MKSGERGILFTLVANGPLALCQSSAREGNFVQFAKRIIGSGPERDGDHSRTYLDSSGQYCFHVLVSAQITFLCFARRSLGKALAFRFLAAVADSFFLTYDSYLEETDTEIFQDFEATMQSLMEEFGALLPSDGALRSENVRHREFCGLREAGSGALLQTELSRVEAWVYGVCAKVRVSKEYHNKTGAEVAVLFTFKQEHAAVVGVEVEREEGRVRVVARELQSNPDYVVREFTKGGRCAFILKEVDDMEQMNVYCGTLAPGARLKVTLTYVFELEMDGSIFELLLPLTRLYGDTAATVFALTIHVRMGSDILGIQCDSEHAIQYEQPNAMEALLTVDSENVLQVNQELRLYITVSSPHTPQLLLERPVQGSRQMTFCLGWNPRFRANPLEDTPLEFIFLVDCTSAMKGRKLKRVKSALYLWLHSLPTNCVFNIMAYGSSIVKLYQRSEPYNDSSLRQARLYVRDMKADLERGGVAAAIYQAVSGVQRGAEGRTRHIFLLMSESDGADAEEVMPLVVQSAHTSRIFTFALGTKSNVVLASRIARSASGMCEYLASDQYLEVALVDKLSRSVGPVLTELEIDWGVPGVRQIPPLLCPVFSDNRVFFVAYGTIEVKELSKMRAAGVQLAIRGKVQMLPSGGSLAKRDVAVSSPEISFSGAPVGDVLSLNAAVRSITTLDARYRTTQEDTVRSLLLEQALAHGVAVEGISELTVVAKRGGGGNGAAIEEEVLVIPRPPSATKGPTVSETPVKAVATPVERKEVAAPPPPKQQGGGLWGRLASYLGNKEGDAAQQEEDRLPFVEQPDTLEDFLCCQRHNGKWLNDASFSHFFTTINKVSKQVVLTPSPGMKQLAGLDAKSCADLWATCLAMSLLTLQFGDLEEAWLMQVSKAKNYLYRTIRKVQEKPTPQSIATLASKFLEDASALLT